MKANQELTPSGSILAATKAELRILAETFKARQGKIGAACETIKWNMFVNGTILRRCQQLIGPRGGYEEFVTREMGLGIRSAQRYANFSRHICTSIPALSKYSLGDLVSQPTLDALMGDSAFLAAFREAANAGINDALKALDGESQKALPGKHETDDMTPEERAEQQLKQAEFVWIDDFVPRIERDILGVGATDKDSVASWALLPAEKRLKLADTLMDAARKIKDSVKHAPAATLDDITN